MSRGLRLLLIAGIPALAACAHTQHPPPKPSSSRVTVEMPMHCEAVPTRDDSQARQAARWKQYALKLERLLGIEPEGAKP